VTDDAELFDGAAFGMPESLATSISAPRATISPSIESTWTCLPFASIAHLLLPVIVIPSSDSSAPSVPAEPQPCVRLALLRWLIWWPVCAAGARAAGTPLLPHECAAFGQDACRPVRGRVGQQFDERVGVAGCPQDVCL